MELRFEKMPSGRIKCGRMEQNCLEEKKDSLQKETKDMNRKTYAKRLCKNWDY